MECDGGVADTYCSSDFVSSAPSCSWNVPNIYPDDSYYAYPYIFDSTGLPSQDTPQGLDAKYYINNLAPSINSMSFNNNEDINLITQSTKAVTLTMEIKDPNSCANNEIPNVVASMYRSGVGYTLCDSSAESNPNNCYPAVTCSIIPASCTGVTDSTANYDCVANFEYYADPTDNVSPFSSETWLATAVATDNGTNYNSGSNPLLSDSLTSGSINVNSLLAFNITNTLSYGSVLPGQSTSPLSFVTTLNSAGNIALNHLVSGVDMCDDYPVCAGAKVPVTKQKYSLNASTDYDSGTVLETTPAGILTNLLKQTTTTPTTRNIWWGIEAPKGLLPKEYTGRNIVDAIVSHE